jgi:predicted DCC family thiol-disulfide oxidoreductase YuxK
VSSLPESGFELEDERPEKPILVYDGKCPFCMFWVNKWKLLAHDDITFVPYQELPEQFYNISRSQFKKSVFLITPYRRLKGAEAVFELLAISGDNTWIYLYRKLPFANKLFELGYGMIANNRGFCYAITKLFYDKAKSS